MVGALAALLLVAASGATEPVPGLAITCAKVLAVDGEDRVFTPGMILVEGGKIAYVGALREVPAGYLRREYAEGWAAPGFVDLHTHVHGVGWGDLNDMVHPVNPELRATPAVVPSNEQIRLVCAGGVTTLFGIPGSGTSLSGFGILYKSKTDARFEQIVLRDPGGLKVAQTHNPERRSGDLGLTWAGLSWLLEGANAAARAAPDELRRDPRLASLAGVHAGELPVLIHCASIVGVASTARMWKATHGTRCVISHGSFNGHLAREYVASLGVPVNHGPRTMDYASTREGRIVGTAARYLEAGVPDFSLNTDSPVIPGEELFLQGAMSTRLGADGYQMLRALTIHPARAFGIDGRVGSLEPGKDADVVVWDGDPLDPRSSVRLVVIDGEVQYEPERDGQWF